MPRQPLVDTPGLPPYGQRSSERRKEQNRLAQRQLRERRQQQEAAQTLKLQQQQTEIRRLTRIIEELRKENVLLKSYAPLRRRQSVIPISSRSRSLAIFCGNGQESNFPGYHPNLKPAYERRSIDCGTMQHINQRGPFTPTNTLLADGSLLRDVGSDEENSFSSPSDFGEYDPNITIFQNPRSLFLDQHVPTTTLAPRLDGEKLVNDVFPTETGSKPDNGLSPARHSDLMQSLTSAMQCEAWLTSSPAEAFKPSAPTAPPVKPFLTSSQRLDSDPHISPIEPIENFPMAMDITAFLPVTSAPELSELQKNVHLDEFSPSSLTEAPSPLLSLDTHHIFHDSPYTRKTSASASSDGSSSNSIFSSAELYPSLSNMSASPINFPFCPQELLPSPMSPTASPISTAATLETVIDASFLRSASSSIFLQSLYSNNKTLSNPIESIDHMGEHQRMRVNSSSPVLPPKLALHNIKTE